MPRTNISIDEDVFEGLSSEAKRTNRTMYAFANEAISVVTKVSSEGGDPASLYQLWRAITVLKQVDVITFPSEFVDDLVAKEYAADKQGILKMFSDLGSGLVGVLKDSSTRHRPTVAAGTGLCPPLAAQAIENHKGEGRRFDRDQHRRRGKTN